jgi:SprT protein
MQLSLFQPEPPPVINHKEDPRNRMRKVLEPHLPEKAVDPVIDWLMDNRTKLRITSSRSSKLGDYRPSGAGKIPVISVNHNLNKYAFLITLVHEMAHHVVIEAFSSPRPLISFRRKKRPKPHGPEWQSHYRKLMASYLDPDIFPGEIADAINRYLENPRASTTADHGLLRVLRKYDTPDGSESLDKLPFDAVFYLKNGRSFRKKERIRKRYRCVSNDNGRIYLFNPMAQVFQSSG